MSQRSIAGLIIAALGAVLYFSAGACRPNATCCRSAT